MPTKIVTDILKCYTVLRASCSHRDFINWLSFLWACNKNWGSILPTTTSIQATFVRVKHSVCCRENNAQCTKQLPYNPYFSIQFTLQNKHWKISFIPNKHSTLVNYRHSIKTSRKRYVYTTWYICNSACESLHATTQQDNMYRYRTSSLDDWPFDNISSVAFCVQTTSLPASYHRLTKTMTTVSR